MQRVQPIAKRLLGNGGALAKVAARVSRFVKRYDVQIKIFLICIVAKTLFNACTLYILRLNKGPDEIGTIAGAAFFAGKDWTELLGMGSQYFGFGYSFFMTPLFWLFSNKLVLYHCMLLYNSVCLAAMLVICYNIVLGLGVDKKYCVWITIASSLFYLPLSASNMVTNDIMLLLLHWVILYMVLLLYWRKCAGKSVIGLSAGLALVMCYGFTVHTRIIYLWGAVAVLIVLYFLMQKKSLVNIPVFGGVFVASYFGASALVNYVQQNAWAISERGEAMNSAESIFDILGRIELLFSRIGLRSYIATVFGQTFGSFVLTGGIIAICLCAFIYLLYVFLRRFFKKEQCDAAELQRQQAVLLIGTYGMAIFAASILITAIGALPYAIEALEAGNSTKWFLYARYWAVGGGSCILFTFLILLDPKIKKKVLALSSAAVLALVLVVVLITLADNFVGASSTGSSVYEPFTAVMLMEWGERFSIFSFVKAAIITVLLFGGIVYGYLNNKLKISCILVAMLSAFIWIYGTLEIERPFSKGQYDTLKDTETFLSVVEAKDNGFRVLINSGLAVTRNAYFSLHEYNLGVFTLGEIEDTDQIVVGSSLSTQCLGEGFYMVYKNGARQAIFIKGEQIEAMALSKGFELVAYDMSEFPQSKLFYIDEYNESSELKGLIPPGGTQYGPYIALPAGNYQITVEGYELEGCTFDAMATIVIEPEEKLQSMDGEEEPEEDEEEQQFQYINIDIKDIDIQNDSVTYTFETTVDYDTVEFRAFNQSDHRAYVHRIRLEKVEPSDEDGAAFIKAADSDT